jgi:hypothetical protein
VRILLPDGHIIIDDATVSITPGERVLIVGDTEGESRRCSGPWRGSGRGGPAPS